MTNPLKAGAEDRELVEARAALGYHTPQRKA